MFEISNLDVFSEFFIGQEDDIGNMDYDEPGLKIHGLDKFLQIGRILETSSAKEPLNTQR